MRDPRPTGRLPWWRRWRTGLLAAFMLVAVTVGAAQLADVASDYRGAERAALDRQVETARALASAADLLLASYVSVAETAAQALFDGPPATAAGRQLLAGIRRARPEVAGVLVIDPAGRVVAAEPPGATGLDVSDLECYRQIVTGASTAVGNLTVGTLSGAFEITVSAAYRGPGGALLGLVTIVLPAAAVGHELDLRLSGGARPLLLDRTGRVVFDGAFPDLDWASRDYSRVPPVAEALAGRLARAHRFAGPSRAEPEIGAVVPVPRLGWAAGVIQPVETILVPARHHLSVALVTIGYILALGVALALLLSTWLSRPIAALAAGVAALARGDLGHRITARWWNEFGVLAEHVNHLGAQLEEARGVNERLLAAAVSERARAEARAAEAQAERRRFEAFMDHGPAVACIKDGGGRYVYVNRSAYRSLGWRPTEAIGKTDLDLMPPEAAAQCRASDQAALEGGRAVETLETVQQADGLHSWMTFKFPLVDADGRRLVGGMAIDITEQKRAADALRLLAEAGSILASSLDHETTLSAVARLSVAALADWCVVDLLDPDGSIRPVGAAHADPRQEPLLRELLRHAPDSGGPHFVANVLRTGRPELIAEVTEEWLRGTPRSPEHLALLRRLAPRSFLCVPLVARARTIGALTFAISQSPRRHGPEDLPLAEELARRAALAVDNARLYQEARAALREARDAVQAREMFLARASHELRTPLTSALGSVRLLKRALAGTLGEPPEAILGITARSLDRMLTLVNQLLDASRLASGRETLVLETVDVAELARRSLEIVGVQAREKGVNVRFEVPDGLRLPADPIKIEQVLVNVLANATKCTPAGGEIAVQAERAAGRVAIRVRDTGEGIALEHLERIFEPFFQVANAKGRSRAVGRGTGLGLTICRQVIELHGGRIWAESDGPGRGSTFTIELPAVTSGPLAGARHESAA